MPKTWMLRKKKLSLKNRISIENLTLNAAGLLVVLLLSGCTQLNPPTRYAPCSNWGHNCHWHKVNKGARYPSLVLPKVKTEEGVLDTNNANNGKVAYAW